jgi:hypothetical protein
VKSVGPRTGIEVFGLFIDYRLTTNIGEKYTFCVFPRFIFQVVFYLYCV